MEWAKRHEAQTITSFKSQNEDAQPQAQELLSRCLATGLTRREFFRQADTLCDGELRLLRHLLIQQSIRQKEGVQCGERAALVAPLVLALSVNQ